jgi:hypothetical protein
MKREPITAAHNIDWTKAGVGARFKRMRDRYTPATGSTYTARGRRADLLGLLIAACVKCSDGDEDTPVTLGNRSPWMLAMFDATVEDIRTGPHVVRSIAKHLCSEVIGPATLAVYDAKVADEKALGWWDDGSKQYHDVQLFDLDRRLIREYLEAC